MILLRNTVLKSIFAGNGESQPYVHPSQQTVPEPRKYTGSSIPSRSFKILQAMTAPDSCGKTIFVSIE